MREYWLRFGDIALFYALIDALDLPERWRLKLRHYFWRPPVFHALLDRLAKGERPDSDGLAAALGRQAGRRDAGARRGDRRRLSRRAKAFLWPATAHCARSPCGSLDHAADLRADPLPKEVATVIDYYLAVAAPPREAADKVAMIAKGAGLDIDAALDATLRRFDRLARDGIDLSRATFATEFGRNLEYYSGVVFQIEGAGMDETEPVAGGGRYDGMLRALGAPRDVPAVGSAIHTERLLAAVEKAA